MKGKQIFETFNIFEIFNNKFVPELSGSQSKKGNMLNYQISLVQEEKSLLPKDNKVFLSQTSKLISTWIIFLGLLNGAADTILHNNIRANSEIVLK